MGSAGATVAAVLPVLEMDSSDGLHVLCWDERCPTSFAPECAVKPAWPMRREAAGVVLAPGVDAARIEGMGFLESHASDPRESSTRSSSSSLFNVDDELGHDDASTVPGGKAAGRT
jgi:hypothetical protein